MDNLDLNKLTVDLRVEMGALRHRMEVLEGQFASAAKRLYVPLPPFSLPSPATPFMSSSTCCFSDFIHPRFMEICGLMKHPFMWQRKLWEWVFVIDNIIASGLAKPGSTGLVFGVGAERLPAVFASMGAQIVATDAPIEIGERNGWQGTGQHTVALSNIRYPEIGDGKVFDSNVTYQTCDMNDILPELTGFDFNWSSCCFEHLGSLEAGMEFVINAVEKTLRIGGLAVHTTEYNLSSNEDTIEEGPTVIYRRRDIEELVQRLRARGHIVNPFIVSPDSHYWDFHVDVPPYNADNFHLRLLLGAYVATSAGIVVRRGR